MDAETGPEQTKEWLSLYSNTKRRYYLHPADLAYETETGSKVSPLQGVMFNDDNTTLNAAKEVYFRSRTFFSLKEKEQRERIELIGVDPRLATELSKRPLLRRLLLSKDIITKGKSI